jgi:hypothetical protein
VKVAVGAHVELAAEAGKGRKSRRLTIAAGCPRINNAEHQRYCHISRTDKSPNGRGIYRCAYNVDTVSRRDRAGFARKYDVTANWLVNLERQLNSVVFPEPLPRSSDDLAFADFEVHLVDGDITAEGHRKVRVAAHLRARGIAVGNGSRQASVACRRFYVLVMFLAERCRCNRWINARAAVRPA